MLACVLVWVCHANPPLSSPPPSPPSLPHTHTPIPCVRSKRTPCVHSKVPRVYRHHARKCYRNAAWCRYTRGRFECTHGGFSALPTPHRDAHSTITTKQHDMTQTTHHHHNTRSTGTERQRETERDRERRQREERRQRKRRDRDKTRQDEREETRQEGKRR